MLVVKITFSVIRGDQIIKKPRI